MSFAMEIEKPLAKKETFFFSDRQLCEVFVEGRINYIKQVIFYIKYKKM